MILWGRNTSSNVQKPMWLMEEMGITYQRVDAGGPFGKNKEAAYLAMNPNGYVPTLVDGSFTLWESNTITRYLAAKYRAETFYPGDLKRRADIERWMDWGMFVLAESLSVAFMGIMRTAPDQRDLSAILKSCAKTEAALRILNNQLSERDYVCGDDLTLADIATGINCYRWYNLPFDSIGFTRPSLPNLQAWYERLSARPAYQKVVMITIS
jgi:glutathione S-transferase